MLSSSVLGLKAKVDTVSLQLVEIQLSFAQIPGADLNKDGKLSFDEYKKLVCAGLCS